MKTKTSTFSLAWDLLALLLRLGYYYTIGLIYPKVRHLKCLKRSVFKKIFAVFIKILLKIFFNFWCHNSKVFLPTVLLALMHSWKCICPHTQDAPRRERETQTPKSTIVRRVHLLMQREASVSWKWKNLDMPYGSQIFDDSHDIKRDQLDHQSNKNMQLK